MLTTFVVQDVDQFVEQFVDHIAFVLKICFVNSLFSKIIAIILYSIHNSISIRMLITNHNKQNKQSNQNNKHNKRNNHNARNNDNNNAHTGRA